MLHLLRERAAEAGVRNLDSVQAGFLSYEHVGPLAHAVYTRNALHHLPDFWKALALTRIAQILRPDGVLLVRDLIYDFETADAEHSIERWLDGAADDAAQGYTRDELAQHVRCEYSTFRWLFEPMLAAAGFQIVSADYRRSVYASYTCVKR
jgi:SAM-dependent methyltransferase